MLNTCSRVWLATAGLCCGYVGIAMANAGTAGHAITQLPARVGMQNNPDTVLNWSNFSIGNGEVAGFFSGPMSYYRVIEPGSSILRGELRDDGQLFLVDRNSAALSGSVELSQGSDLTLGRLQINVLESIAVGGRGNVTLTAGAANKQGFSTGYDTRWVAGATISVSGGGDTVVIAPAGYVVPGPGNSVQLVGGVISLLESFPRHGHSTFLSANHWNSEDRRRGRHGEDGEFHAGYYAGHHGGGPRWSFHDGCEYCEISPSIPEPRSYALMLAGLLVLWAIRRRWKNNARSDASA